MKAQPEIQKSAQLARSSQPFYQRQKTNPFFTTQAIQRKPTLGKPNDSYEQEADRVADAVVSGKNGSPSADGISAIQRNGGDKEDEEQVQAKGETNAPETVSNDFANQLNSTSGGGAALPKSVQANMSQNIGADFSNVRIHTNGQAEQMSQDINAKAFTHGNDIYFNEGQYNPETKTGQHLLAHELTHTVQQGAVRRMVQREVIDMPPMTIHSGMPNTTPLTGDLEDTSGMTMSVDPARITTNTVDPTTPLPFTPSGWDSNDIMLKMGQYDRIPGTDSDAVRCVQAVGLMSHVAVGIGATRNYLSAMSLQALLRGPNQRNQTSIAVLEEVMFRLTMRDANYGHLYWAMEAMHAIFNKDDRGTDQAALQDVIVPGFDLSMNMQRLNQWCASPAEIITQGATLANGEQFMLNTWSVSFNSQFENVPGRETSETADFTVEGDRSGRVRHITRIHIPAGTKPAASQIDDNRDNKSGHQLLLMKDPADGHLKLYEPELTATGQHLIDLTVDATALDTYFTDQPAFEIFEYVQILGKMTPMGTSSFAAP